MDQTRTVVVWGNCQAPAIADLLRGPLGEAGLDVVRLPPVYQVSGGDLADLRPALDRCAAFVTQPVREAVFGGGRGSDTLAALLPATAAVIRFPVTYWTGPFPFQVHGHGADGIRVDAAVTDYHDVRAAVAARAGMTAEDAVAWWPALSPDDVRTRAAASRAELRRREQGLEIATSDLLGDPAALWTMTHPANTTLAAIAGRILDRLVGCGVIGSVPPVAVPAREYLGQRRAPLESAVTEAFGWPAAAVRPDWTIDGVDVPLVELLRVQLAQYRQRPDVVDDIVTRHASGLLVPGHRTERIR